MNEPHLSEETEAENNQAKRSVLNSALTVFVVTIIFGLLSYGLIMINNTFFNFPISVGMWCVLAMILVIGYFLLNRLYHHLSQQP